MKMSEHFELPFEPIDYQNGIIDGNGFGVLFGDFHEYEKKALCEAVNNYDNIKEEVKLLRKALRSSSDALERLINSSESDKPNEIANARNQVHFALMGNDILLSKI